MKRLAIRPISQRIGGVWCVLITFCFALGSDIAVAQNQSDPFATPEVQLELDAREFLGHIDRAKNAVQALQDANEVLEEKIRELEAQLVAKPEVIEGITEAAAAKRINELSKQRNTIRNEVGTENTELTDVRAKARAAYDAEVSRLAATKPSAQLLDALFGAEVSGGAPNVDCTDSLQSAALIVCRNADLVNLDRTLRKISDARVSQVGRAEALVQARGNKDFVVALRGCVPNSGALMANPNAIKLARECARGRYEARIAQLSGGDGASALETELNQVWYTSVNANFRSVPSTDGSVVEVVDVCTNVKVVGKIIGIEWYKVTVGTKTAFMHGSTISRTLPARCRAAKKLAVIGDVTRLVDVATLVIDGNRIRLAGVIPKGGSAQLSELRSFLKQQFGNKLACETPADVVAWACYGTVRKTGKRLDLGLVTIFNGAACPASNARDEYKKAYLSARSRGSSLRC